MSLRKNLQKIDKFTPFIFYFTTMFVEAHPYMYDETYIDKIQKMHRDLKRIASKGAIASSSTIINNNVEHQVFYKTQLENNRNQIWFYTNGITKRIFVKNEFYKEFDRFGDLTRTLDLKTGEEELIDNNFPYITIKRSQEQKYKQDYLVTFDKTEYYRRSASVKSVTKIVKNISALNSCWRRDYNDLVA
jgi:hypothetical protein